MDEVRQQRERLRQKLRAERSALGPAELRAAAEACCTHARPLLRGARVVALYAASRGEIDPSSLMGGGLRVVWPRVEDEQSLTFREGPLQPGRFDILAPAADAPAVDAAALDLVFVPGLAFDRAGNRLGYGRGYYDRALAASPRALRVGLCHSFQLVDSLPAHAADEPVDFIVTPDGAHPTGARGKETP